MFIIYDHGFPILQIISADRNNIGYKYGPR